MREVVGHGLCCIFSGGRAKFMPQPLGRYFISFAK